MVILSYNIQSGEGFDKKIDLVRLARVITSVSPDVVSLQEVDGKTGRSNGIDQAQELARLANLEFVYGPAREYDGGQYGNAVLTKHAVEKSRCIFLPGEEIRSALSVTIRMSSGPTANTLFTFIATHLDCYSEKGRIESVPLIESLFESDANKPAILAGDMNATPESPTMLMLGRTWTNATSQNNFFTFPAESPSMQIDYILYRPADRWRVTQTRVINDDKASDHRAIVAVLELLPCLDTKEK
ncbi:MAG: endonuclease/exonuclease/phosphatase family protein [Kiritimatiellia bacterium]|nr:endonuclease/exonuclease/phosphatase family protein [Kiritimatiellia bacterium]